MVPASLLSESGEKCSRSLGRKPTSEEPPDTPMAKPPLSATPGGVTTDQCDDDAVACRTCQKVFAWSEIRPIGRITHEPVGDEVALSRGGRAGDAPAGRASAHTDSATPAATTVSRLAAAATDGRAVPGAPWITNRGLGRCG